MSLEECELLKCDPVSLRTFPPWPDTACHARLLAMEKCELLSPGLSNEEHGGGSAYQSVEMWDLLE